MGVKRGWGKLIYPGAVVHYCYPGDPCDGERFLIIDEAGHQLRLGGHEFVMEPDLATDHEKSHWHLEKDCPDA